ncbi:MAG: helix-turn-helix domain-containing protein [Candidatus Woesearchaeota archaeon]
MEKELRRLGLTAYETKVYLTLLKEGPKKGGETSRLSQVPNGKTYEALENLQHKGFVSVLPFRPKVFSPISPEVAIKHYSSIRIEELNRLEGQLIQKSKNLLKPMKQNPEVIDKFTLIRGFKNERQFSKYNYDNANRYVKNISTYEFVSSYARAEARKRGVQIYQIATNPSINLKKKAQLEKDVKIRYYPLEELRLRIIDGNKSMIGFVNPDNNQDRIGMFIESKELSEALELYFDQIWKKAKVIK